MSLSSLTADQLPRAIEAAHKIAGDALNRAIRTADIEFKAGVSSEIRAAAIEGYMRVFAAVITGD